MKLHIYLKRKLKINIKRNWEFFNKDHIFSYLFKKFHNLINEQKQTSNWDKRNLK